MKQQVDSLVMNDTSRAGLKLVRHKRYFGFTAEKGRFTATRFTMKFYFPIDLKEAE